MRRRNAGACVGEATFAVQQYSSYTTMQQFQKQVGGYSHSFVHRRSAACVAYAWNHPVSHPQTADGLRCPRILTA